MTTMQVVSAFIGVMPTAMHRHVSPRMAKPYVWATSTGATVDVDTPSRGVTLEARDSGCSSAVYGFYIRRLLLFPIGAEN
ncbi:hypothetical protein ig2599ANME_1628 [groundwater metagenome]